MPPIADWQVNGYEQMVNERERLAPPATRRGAPARTYVLVDVQNKDIPFEVGVALTAWERIGLT